MAKSNLFTFSVPVTVPAATSRTDAKRLLERVVQAGLEEAAHAPDDFDDPDAEVIQQMTVGTVTLIGEGYSHST